MGKHQLGILRLFCGFLLAAYGSDSRAAASGVVDAHGIWEASTSDPAVLGPESCRPIEKIIQAALDRMSSTDELRKKVSENCEGIETDGVGSLPPGRRISRGVGSLPPGRKVKACPLKVQETHNGVMVSWDDPDDVRKWGKALLPWAVVRNLAKPGVENPGVYVQTTNCPSISDLRPAKR